MKKIAYFMLAMIAAIVALVVATAVGNGESGDDDYMSESIIQQLLGATNQVDEGDAAARTAIVENGKSDYTIVYSKSETGASGKAYSLSELFYSACKKVDISTKADTAAETSKEILWGKTNRQLSKDLISEVEQIVGDEPSYVWAIACRDGQLAVYISGGSYATEMGEAALKALVSADGDLVVNDGFKSINVKSHAEYEEELEEEKYQKRLEEILKNFNSFDGSDEFKTTLVFEKGVVVDRIVNEGGAELMPTNAFEYPSFTPTKGDHPRILVTSDMLPRLREVLEDPSYEVMARKFWEYADAVGVTGIIPVSGTVTHKNGTPDDPSDDYTYENHHNRGIMWKIEAKALAYLLTGDPIYGYEAIYAIKNAILTTRYWTASQQDTYHAYACVMEVAAYVYDWCYDLMDDEDKTQIIDGIRFYLAPYIEFTYPPSNMGYVSGHGTGAQMFRVWITLAAAMADERPDWWAYVGGRFYQYYIPVVNQMYASGFVSQGTNYGIGKWGVQMYSAYMLETMGDTSSMDDGISRKAPYYIMSMMMPNGNFFQTADATNGVGHTSYGHSVKELAWAFISAALTDDPFMLAYAYNLSDKATSFDSTDTDHITPALMAILISACDAELSADMDISVDLIKHTGFPGGETSIRNSWSENAVALYMKVGDRTMANHDHRDSGHFQIYYKGLLACDSGYYTGVSYGSNHSKYYQQATVAHNGLLVYDPAKATDKFYSGGQIRVGEANSIDKWNGGQYDFAKIIGHAEGFSQDGSAAKYAYIAGDMTNSYDSASVNYIARHMLTIMQNGNEGVPMVMFIYDDIESVNTESIKKFLLHTVNEPIVEDGKVVAVEGEGKLTLVPLFGVDKIEKIGGADKEYWVGKDAENGYNVIDGIESYDPNKTLPGRGFIWGRVELSATGNETNRMLNMIFVSDADSNATVDARVFETEQVLGAEIDGSVVAFAKERSRGVSEFTVTSEGEGLVDYYIAGVKDGVWSVSVNGEYLGTTYAGADQHFLKFTAPAGEVTLTPYKVETRYEIVYNTYDASLPSGTPKKYVEGVGIEELATPVHPHGGFVFEGWYTNPEFEGEAVSSISPESVGTVTLYAKWNGSQINYVDNGGNLPEDAQLYYLHGVGLSALPTPTHPDGYEFLGWYSDAMCKNQVFSISSETEGIVTVYAKWKKPPAVYASYDGTNKDNKLSGALSQGYIGDRGVFKWSTAKDGPIVTVAPKGDNYSVMYGDLMAISFTVSIAKVPDTAVINSSFRTFGYKGDAAKELVFFRINSDGVVSLGKSGPAIFTLTEELQTLRIVMNFETGKLTVYNEKGFPIEETDAALPSGVADFEEFRGLFNNSTNLINWRANSAGALYIGDLVIEEGDTHLSEEAKIAKMVDYKTNGGTLPEGYEYIFIPGTGLSALPTPTHPNGFEFLGWYDNEAFEGDQVTFVGADVNDNVTVYAKWAGSKIKYELSDGTLPEGAVDYFVHGVGLSALPTPTHPLGFEFLGWYANAEFTGDAVTCIGKDVTVGVTLYAKWAGAYITYFTNGASLPEGYPTSYKYGVGISALPVPTHPDGYKFLGWYTNSAFVNYVTSIGTDATGNVSLYAKWERDPAVYLETDGSHKSYITSSFRQVFGGVFAPVDTDGDGAEDAIEWSIKHGGEETTMPNLATSQQPFGYATMYGGEHAISITVNMSKIPGYGLFSTSLRIGGTSIGGIVTIFNTSAKGAITLNGSSKVIGAIGDEMSTLRVVVDFDNAKILAYNSDGVLLDSVGFKAPAVDGKTLTAEEWRQIFIEGVNLINWRIQGYDGSTNEDGSERRYGIYIGDIKIEESNIFRNENTDKATSITFDTNGGSFAEGVTVPEYFFKGTELTDLPTPTHPEGGVFAGWYKEADFSGEPVTSIGADETEPITLYARWELSEIIYNTNGATLPDGAPTYYLHGVGLSSLPTPTHPNGYEFVGWYADSTFTSAVTGIGADIKGDVALFAKWVADPIVYFNTDGSSKTGITSNFKKGYAGVFEPRDTDGDGAADAIEWSINTVSGETVRPNLSITSSTTYSTMYGSEHAVSFTIDLASMAGHGNLVTTFRFGGSKIGGTVEIFTTSAAGAVKLKNGSKVLFTIGEEMQTLRVVFDFDNSKIYAYDENGELLDTVSTKAPSSFSGTLEEWRQSYTGVDIMNWYLSGQEATEKERCGMYIGQIKIEEGNVFAK